MAFPGDRDITDFLRRDCLDRNTAALEIEALGHFSLGMLDNPAAGVIGVDRPVGRKPKLRGGLGPTHALRPGTCDVCGTIEAGKQADAKKV